MVLTEFETLFVQFDCFYQVFRGGRGLSPAFGGGESPEGGPDAMKGPFPGSFRQRGVSCLFRGTASVPHCRSGLSTQKLVLRGDRRRRSPLSAGASRFARLRRS